MIDNDGEAEFSAGQAMAQLLASVEAGQISAAAALQKWQQFSSPLPSLELDLNREQRTGAAEIIFGQGKSREELLAATRRLAEHHGRAMVTRLEAPEGLALEKKLAKFDATYHPRARCLVIDQLSREAQGHIVLLCAGTTDLPVAEEARLCAEFVGAKVEKHYDVGVAGLHRVLNHLPSLRTANVVIVVAGMDGALPSVVAGLTPKPVLAVPTSVGYGASFGGIAALLAMLNACAPGVSVLNIDNGCGAGLCAARINRWAVGS